jgi:23S rRNA-/tRNA-specific pseudouridylate synthase
MRLDQAIASKYGLSRRKAREAIASGTVLVNQRPVRIASREVSESDELAMVGALPEVPVIRETADWIAVNKPVGLATQPERDRGRVSLEEILRVQHRTIYLVHRLDTPTSGVVIFAKTQAAAARLSGYFAAGAMRKTYVARVAPPIASEITIDAPLDGKESLTIARPREDGLVAVEIKTGRTHQIRRHLSSIGHPVVGDRRYGGAPAPRLMLHAWKLEHGETGTLEAPIPPELIA